MTNPDVRLLKVFELIYRTRSVSRTAETLDLGQPAVSIALAKLRHHFGDPLFVRTSGGMEPTPLGEELVVPVRRALEALEGAFGHRTVFDPASSDRTFRIAMADISQPVLLPGLWSRLRKTAPGVCIDVVPLTGATPVARLLETGAVDMAIGFIPQLEAGFYQQVLFRQNYMVLASADHPRVRGGLTLEQFQEEDHAVFAANGTGHQMIDEEVARQGIRRRIAMTSPTIIGAAFVVESTDLLMVIPRRLGEILRGRGNFAILPLPFPMPEYAVKQHWHERHHVDPGDRWLRGVIADLLSEGAVTPRGRGSRRP